MATNELDGEVASVLREMKHYIEEVEETMDGEWGRCRDFAEMKEDGEIPGIYRRITKLLETK